MFEHDDDTITVSPHTAAKLKIETDHSTLSALSDHFAYRPKGYQFTPTFKNKVWDGYIRLFDTRTKTLPVGLLHRLRKFSDDYGVELIDNTSQTNNTFEVSEEDVIEFAESLNIHSDGNKITTRDYQISAVHLALTTGRMVALAPTSAGKSLIIYIYLRYLIDNIDGGKFLLIVPSTGLVHQMLGDFLDYQTGSDGNCVCSTDMGEFCHIIMAGKKKSSDKQIYISTWQSLQTLAKEKNIEYFAQFDAVIVDEVHGAKSKTITSILDQCINAHRRFGLTGTLDGTELMQIALEGLFGEVIQITTTKELMDRGEVAQLDVKVIMLEHPEKVRKMFTKIDYPTEIAYLTQHDQRNRFIAKLGVSCSGNTLILIEKVDTHGKLIYDKIVDIVGESGRKVFFINGKMDGAERNRIKGLIEHEEDAIIVATYGCLSTGVSIKRLHNVIFGSPSKSQIRVLQSLGRGLRLGKNKSACNLFDIADDISWKKHKNFALLHAIERIKMYANQKFKYKLSKVAFK